MLSPDNFKNDSNQNWIEHVPNLNITSNFLQQYKEYKFGFQHKDEDDKKKFKKNLKNQI